MDTVESLLATQGVLVQGLRESLDQMRLDMEKVVGELSNRSVEHATSIGVLVSTSGRLDRVSNELSQSISAMNAVPRDLAKLEEIIKGVVVAQADFDRWRSRVTGALSMLYLVVTVVGLESLLGG